MALRTRPTALQDAVPQNVTAGWWPSKYGAGDEAGALNKITPGKVLEAVSHGLVYDLAYVLHQDITLPPINALRVADHIAGRLGAVGLPEAQPLVTAHA